MGANSRLGAYSNKYGNNYNYRYKIHKNLNNALNQNVTVTKQTRFASLAMFIIDNLCLLKQ